MIMELQHRINAFVHLGRFIGQFSSENHSEKKGVHLNEVYFEAMKEQLAIAEVNNGWFSKGNLRFALMSWSEALSEENLKQWCESYTFTKKTPTTVAIIMAGNIPLVGFHDFLSVLLSGNKVLGKLSSNDKFLLPFFGKYLEAIEPQFKECISFTSERMTGFDAVIATGSNNTARYFEYYFGKYPNIIRKNRNTLAILTGKESEAEMKELSNDIFRYFGLGCRNVSKIYLPKDYNFDHFFNAMYHWKDVINDSKYMNNYDYNKAVYLMSNIDLLDNEFMLLKEDETFSSPISVVFYEKYDDINVLREKLVSQSENIQCIVGNNGTHDEVNFGVAQTPKLWDYADGVDTMDFLLKLT